MTLLNKRTVSVIILIWAIILVGAVAGKQWYLKHFLKTSSQQKAAARPFIFDEPTTEELRELQIDQSWSNKDFISIPLAKNLTVFTCPQKTCAILGILKAGSELYIDINTVQDTDEWLTIPWPDLHAGPSQGYVLIQDLENTFQKPPPVPQKSIDVSALQTTTAEPVPINPQTLVGIVCEFQNNDNTDVRVTRGSGVIVSPEGHIITARSVVDIGYVNEGLEDYQRNYCLVGQMLEKQPLPNIEAIKKINAYVRLPYLAYTADIAYIPPDAGLSDYEKAWLDFAVIKISGINSDAQFFGGPTSLPDEFPVAPLLISDLPKVNDETLNFAFPSGTTIGTNSDIRTLFMQGLISHVTNYWAGDQRYTDDLFLIETHLDTEDTAGGRFGSPIFWKGYIIGIHTAKQQQSLQIYNVSAKAVLENLFDNQFNLPLEVQ